ncbi:hypothetical protein HK100_007917 [Physocladia obscura]|uniref:Uncharacterized protein n=1 Tax=Physocladia obscura TaxID=109957 RepID=A0AAD5SNR7_9FUNG|nr:hypothetical protein HK100_007917 [Physocladia obscura]
MVGSTSEVHAPSGPASGAGGSSRLESSGSGSAVQERRRAPGGAPQQQRRRGIKGTVASLAPTPAITVIESARIIQAAQLMAAKKMDCVLAVNAQGQLSGILTDKDIAYRVVAGGLDIRTTTVRDVMTRDPVAVFATGPRNDALGVMVGRRFRHLPVISRASAKVKEEDEDADEEDLGSQDGSAAAAGETSEGNSDSDSDSDDGGTNVVGVLDITRCVFDKLDELARKVAQSSTECPDLAAVLRGKEKEAEKEADKEKDGEAKPKILGATPGQSVVAAAALMRDTHETGVLVVAPAKDANLETISVPVPALVGILTTKDIVARVVAQGLDPTQTRIDSVMTPNPKNAQQTTSILDALKLLHGKYPLCTLTILTAGHYLHLPVCDGATPIGLVDVLTLTISMLEYMLTGNQSTIAVPETSGPLWNQFWNSTWSTADSESNAGSEAYSDDHPVNLNHGRYSTLSSTTSNTYYNSNLSARNSYLNGSSQQRSTIPAQVRSPISHYHDPTTTHLQQQQLQLQQHLQLQQQQLQQLQQQSVMNAISIARSNGGATSPTTNNGGSMYEESSGTRVGIKLTDLTRGKVLRFSIVNNTTLDELKAIAAGRLGVPATGANGIGKLSYEDDDGDWVLLSGDADLDDAIGMARRLGEKLNVRAGDILPQNHVGSEQFSVSAEAAAVAAAAAAAAEAAVVTASTRGYVVGDDGNKRVVSATDNNGSGSAGSAGRSGGNSVFDILRDAPLPVNVAISAGIVVAAAFVLSRLSANSSGRY